MSTPGGCLRKNTLNASPLCTTSLTENTSCRSNLVGPVTTSSRPSPVNAAGILSLGQDQLLGLLSKQVVGTPDTVGNISDICSQTLLFKIGYLNVQGMNEKHVVLNNFANENRFDILCLSEHWCEENEISFHILDDFQLVNSFCRKQHIRGGVAIYIKKALVNSSNRLDLSFLCIELHFEATCIYFENLKIIVVTLYRSPRGDPLIFLEKLEELLNLFLSPQWKKYSIVVGGDINASFDVTKDIHSVNEFKNLLRQFNFSYTNSKPTRELACLDNIFTNVSREQVCCDIAEFNFSDHDAVWVEIKRLNLNDEKKEPKVVITRPMTQVRISFFMASLEDYDWNMLFDNLNHCSADVVFDKFFHTLLNLFDTNVPQRKCKVNPLTCNKNRNRHRNSWYTSQLADMKNILLLHLEFYRLHKTDRAKLSYLNARRDYKLAVNEAKKQYNFLSIETSKNKCKKAWSVINTVAKSKQKDSILISPNEFNVFCVQSVDDICESIDRPNETVSDLLKCHNVNHPLEHRPYFSFSEVTPDEILNIVKKLNPSDSVDIYDLSCNILKKIINCIVVPLTHCINKCLIEGVFPEVLKLSRVVPIYKKGERNCPSSYRPISLTPVLSKVLESVIYYQVCDYLEGYNILSPTQFGFRKGKSTVQAIDSLIKKVLSAYENKQHAMATFCDLSKAFDCVEHHSLLDKLVYYRLIDSKVGNIFDSFLNNRKQIVCIGRERSKIAEIKCGVPQGSVLGPLLFILMINDLPSYINNSHSILYADDTTFFNASSELDTLENITKETLSQVSIWFRANGFHLNESKTQQSLFSLRDLPIEHLSSVKFLGVIIDSKLSWEPHIKYVSVKLSRVVYLLRNLKNHVPLNYVRSAYFAFFQSVITYGLLLWGNSRHIQNILILQKKVIRIITGSEKLAHCKPLFIDLKVLTVVNLYIYTVLLYTKNNLSEHPLRQDVHTHNTRNNRNMDIPFCRLSKSLNSYEVVGMKMFNKLPLEWIEAPFNLFKQRLYDWLVNTPFYSVGEFFECVNVTLM